MHASVPHPRGSNRHPAETSEIETVAGTVDSIVFRNEDSGFSILSVTPASPPSRPFRLTGSCAAVWVGEELTAQGRWVLHPRHGRQFQAESLTCIVPSSLEGVRRYLSSGLIRGIGKINAQRLVDHFGTDTLRIIESESARLEEVEGIGPLRRQRIKESWNAQRGIRDIMIFLQSHGVGTAQAARIYRQYGTDAIALVRRNPYRLCHDVWGIGFRSADRIAERVGIARDSEIRARAALDYQMEQESENGHCFAYESELLLTTQALLDIPMEILTRALASALADRRLVREDDRVYLRSLHEAECRVAGRLRALCRAPFGFRPIHAERAIAWAESRMSIRMTADQHAALRGALESKVAVITGGPGVGKTTIIRALTEIYHARQLTVELAAPTGRAAKRMSEACGREARTLHRLLAYNPRTHTFDHNDTKPLDVAGVILDETSMVDIALMDHLLRALPDPAFLVLVGDIHQLPSVGPGHVLGDIIASETVPCKTLNTIFRQDASGLIVQNAHRINQGEFVQNGDADSDFFFIEASDPEQVAARMIELVQRRIPRRFGFDPRTQIQVLTPMRRNTLGADRLNNLLQAALNPNGPSIERFGTCFREQDRVMQIRNNYDKEVFNGDIGWIRRVVPEDRQLVVDIDGRPVVYEHSELDELVLAYACSIHKSQGSEYPAVIVLMTTQHYKLLQRNLLYTAITRGRNLVCLLGSAKAVAIAIRNVNLEPRRTTLRQRICAPNAGG